MNIVRTFGTLKAYCAPSMRSAKGDERPVSRLAPFRNLSASGTAAA